MIKITVFLTYYKLPPINPVETFKGEYRCPFHGLQAARKPVKFDGLVCTETSCSNPREV
jgi:hypothetical protein